MSRRLTLSDKKRMRLATFMRRSSKPLTNWPSSADPPLAAPFNRTWILSCQIKRNCDIMHFLRSESGCLGCFYHLQVSRTYVVVKPRRAPQRPRTNGTLRQQPQSQQQESRNPRQLRSVDTDCGDLSLEGGFASPKIEMTFGLKGGNNLLSS